MDNTTDLFHHAPRPRVQARVVALKHAHLTDNARHRTLRMMVLWLLFCCAFTISLSAALTFAL